MRKIFIDCGFHYGEGLQHFINHLNIRGEWIVVVFEPNPACNVHTRVKIEEGDEAKLFIFQMAVWVRGGLVNFRQENHAISQSGSPSDGSSMIDGWASQVAELNGHWPGLAPPILVPCIDFSNFLSLFLPEDEIYVKMDIEGSEFPVLRKLLENDQVKFIKKLWVEFHERFIPGETIQTTGELIKQLRQHTEVALWH